MGGTGHHSRTEGVGHYYGYHKGGTGHHSVSEGVCQGNVYLSSGTAQNPPGGGGGRDNKDIVCIDVVTSESLPAELPEVLSAELPAELPAESPAESPARSPAKSAAESPAEVPKVGVSSIPRKTRLRPPDRDFLGLGLQGAEMCFQLFHRKLTDLKGSQSS